MGDTLLMTPLIRALRLRHPEARLTVVTRETYAPLFQHNPRITEVIGWRQGSSLAELGRRLRAARFRHRLDLHGSLRSYALRLRVGGRWTSYPKHRAARAALIRTKRNLYRDRRPVAERYFDAARELDVVPDAGSLELFLPRATLEAAEQFLTHRGIGTRRQLIAVAPGASRFTKRWPRENWEMLCRALVARGYDVAVLTGADFREDGTAVTEAGGVNAASTAGALGLQETAAVLRRSEVLVSGDTGLMHLATAVGTPVVALFGPTVHQFGFFPYRSPATILELALGCRPCSAQGGPRCPLGHHRCMREITVEMVMEGVRSEA